MSNYRTVKTRDLGLKIISGNTGIGKTWNVSKDQRTCGALSQYCKDECYMRKFLGFYKGVHACHAYNTDIFFNLETQSNWSRFVEDMSCFFEKHNVRFFRVDVNGDLISKNEIHAWWELAWRFPNTNILCYTKRVGLFDSHVLDMVHTTPNLHVYLSLFHTMPDEVQDTLIMRGLPLCYAGHANPYGFRECEKPCDSCRYCYQGKGDVFIPLH